MEREKRKKKYILTYLSKSLNNKDWIHNKYITEVKYFLDQNIKYIESKPSILKIDKVTVIYE